MKIFAGIFAVLFITASVVTISNANTVGNFNKTELIMTNETQISLSHEVSNVQDVEVWDETEKEPNPILN